MTPRTKRIAEETSLAWLGAMILILTLFACHCVGCKCPTCPPNHSQSTDRFFQYTTSPTSTMPSKTIGVSYKIHREDK